MSAPQFPSGSGNEAAVRDESLGLDSLAPVARADGAQPTGEATPGMGLPPAGPAVSELVRSGVAGVLVGVVCIAALQFFGAAEHNDSSGRFVAAASGLAVQAPLPAHAGNSATVASEQFGGSRDVVEEERAAWEAAQLELRSEELAQSEQLEQSPKTESAGAVSPALFGPPLPSAVELSAPQNSSRTGLRGAPAKRRISSDAPTARFPTMRD